MQAAIRKKETKRRENTEELKSYVNFTKKLRRSSSMLKKKKFLSIIMTIIMIISLSACKSKDEPTDAPATVAPTQAEATPTEAPVVEKEEPVIVTEGQGVTFEDGKYDFIMLNTAPGNADKSEISIVDFNGSKALKVDVKENKIPYVAIDVSSLVGDKITDVYSIEMTVSTEYPDGKFYASSGFLYAYSGENRTESRDAWSVYLETKNPNLAKGVLENKGEAFVANAYNFFVFTKETDNGITKGVEGCDLYIDNIIIRDVNGNPIPVDTSVSFNKPAGFGADDLSNLTKVVGEAVIDGGTGSSTGGWGQAVQLNTLKNDGGVFDPSILKPGTIVTIWFSSASAPELVLQSWTDGKPEAANWAKVTPFAVNDSISIAQYKYDDMVAAFGTDDFITYLDNFIVGDTGNALSVAKISYGSESTGEEVEIQGATGTSAGGWGQAVVMQTIKNDGGTFDPSLLKEGCIVSVYYNSEICPELILQSWTDGKPEAANWAKVAASADTGTVATYTYEDMVAAFGTTDLATYLDAFNVGDCGAALEVTKVTIQ